MSLPNPNTAPTVGTAPRQGDPSIGAVILPLIIQPPSADKPQGRTNTPYDRLVAAKIGGHTDSRTGFLLPPHCPPSHSVGLEIELSGRFNVPARAARFLRVVRAAGIAARVLDADIGPLSSYRRTSMRGVDRPYVQQTVSRDPADLAGRGAYNQMFDIGDSVRVEPRELVPITRGERRAARKITRAVNAHVDAVHEIRALETGRPAVAGSRPTAWTDKYREKRIKKLQHRADKKIARADKIASGTNWRGRAARLLASFEK